MDLLRQDTGHRLQMLRVNLKEPFDVEIAEGHGVTFTHTFQLFRLAGPREAEFTLVLHHTRVPYWPDQRTITP